MIQVIDRIVYLPKNSKDLENEIYNQAYKSAVDEIKKKMRRIDTGGKSATVTISGRVVKRSTNFDVNISNCDDEDLLKRIESALNG